MDDRENDRYCFNFVFVRRAPPSNHLTVVFDLDNTLLDEWSVRPYAIETLRALKATNRVELIVWSMGVDYGVSERVQRLLDPNGDLFAATIGVFMSTYDIAKHKDLSWLPDRDIRKCILIDDRASSHWPQHNNAILVPEMGGFWYKRNDDNALLHVHAFVMHLLERMDSLKSAFDVRNELSSFAPASNKPLRADRSVAEVRTYCVSVWNKIVAADLPQKYLLSPATSVRSPAKSVRSPATSVITRSRKRTSRLLTKCVKRRLLVVPGKMSFSQAVLFTLVRAKVFGFAALPFVTVARLFKQCRKRAVVTRTQPSRVRKTY